MTGQDWLWVAAMAAYMVIACMAQMKIGAWALDYRHGGIVIIGTGMAVITGLVLLASMAPMHATVYQFQCVP